MKKMSWLWRTTVLALIFSACELNDEVVTPPLQNELMQPSSNIVALHPQICSNQTWTLWAGQNINAGTLNVANDNENLYVTYEASADYTFGNLHLWVGTDLSLLPKSGGGAPIPGQFPYTFDATGLTLYTFTLPLVDLAGWSSCDHTTFFVVAHAEMIGNTGTESQTAFGGDQDGTGARWWKYASYAVKCCVNPPPPPGKKYGTAFIKGGYVFTTDKKSNPENLPSLNLTKNRWGWAVNLKSAGTKSYDIWTGAGLNNTAKGIKVGTATIEFTGAQATITYNYLPGFSFEETHIYAGDFKPNTLAPGQYGYTEYYDPFANTDTFTFSVSDSNSDGVWLILHSIAYGPSLTNPN